jgi:hypothetical protein
MKSNGKSKKSKLPYTFSQVRNVSDLGVAETLDGYKVYRQDKIWIPAWGRFVVCAPYDNHFVYEDKSGVPQRWAHMCTCGYMAAVVGSKVYAKDASPTSGEGIMPGEMLVCLAHAQYGKHADGST